VAVAAPLTEEAIQEQKQQKELLRRDALLDLDTAISRAGVGGDADDDCEIHPDTLSVCESVRAKFGLNVEMESAEVRCVLSNLQQITNRSSNLQQITNRSSNLQQITNRSTQYLA